jgi:hypothetical protein
VLQSPGLSLPVVFAMLATPLRLELCQLAAGCFCGEQTLTQNNLVGKKRPLATRLDRDVIMLLEDCYFEK